MFWAVEIKAKGACCLELKWDEKLEWELSGNLVKFFISIFSLFPPLPRAKEEYLTQVQGATF
ncbi:MAG TPA: hypothetical protein DEP38_17215 [Cyanobacteria bacterium UBA9226]|nr:hypothetical protein [Cyanobacteria bacterium UBA9226]